MTSQFFDHIILYLLVVPNPDTQRVPGEERSSDGDAQDSARGWSPTFVPRFDGRSTLRGGGGGGWRREAVGAEANIGRTHVPPSRGLGLWGGGAGGGGGGGYPLAQLHRVA